MKPLSGIYAALLTGFSESAEFDVNRQKNIVDYVIRQNITGLYVGGSSGESGLMTTEELLSQQRVVSELAKGKISKLIAHVGLPSVIESIRLAKQAETLGYDAVSALPPHAYPFSDEEIFAYYSNLSAATSLPLIVYEVPARTGREIPIDKLEQLLHIPNVIGIKFTSTDLYKLSRLKKRCPDKTFYFGYDEMYAAAATQGVDGGIGTTYNILGNLYTALHEAVEKRDPGEIRQLQEVSQDFVEALLEIGVIPGMKLAFQAIGVDCGPSRAPLLPKSKNAEEKILTTVNNPEFRKWLALS